MTQMNALPLLSKSTNVSTLIYLLIAEEEGENEERVENKEALSMRPHKKVQQAMYSILT